MRLLLGVNLQVRCADGSTHNNVRLFAENNRRVYIAEDGSELMGVDSVHQCNIVVTPNVLANAIHACKECEK